jgi:hypothetical protein
MCHVFINDQAMMPPTNAHDFSTDLEDDLLKKESVPPLHIVPFCEGPNEGFAKQKQSAIFAMRHPSQLVVHHPSLIYNVPLIIAALLRHIQQTKLCDPLSLRPP